MDTAIAALYTSIVAILIGTSSVVPAGRVALLAAAAGWMGLIVTIAAPGGFAPGVLGPVLAGLLP